MEILIKNMVCRHCISAVKGVLQQLGVPYTSVELGKVTVPEPLDDAMLNKLDCELAANGFERITDSAKQTVELIKRCIMHHVRTERKCPLNLSVCLTESIPMSYDAMSRIFSATEGRTLEKYYIAQKIELVKELLEYKELTLNEIAERAGYSSVAHLSRQFKQITGMTPTAYSRQPHEPRTPLSEV